VVLAHYDFSIIFTNDIFMYSKTCDVMEDRHNNSVAVTYRPLNAPLSSRSFAFFNPNHALNHALLSDDSSLLIS
jgi:hypothetical protein